MDQQASVIITKEILGKIEELFKGIPGIVKEGGQYFWPILVKQQVVVGIAICVGTMLTTIISTTLLLIGWSIYKKDRGNDGQIPFFIIGSVLVIFAIILFGVAVGVGIPQILNPEYYAFQDLIGMVRGKVCQ